MYHGYINIAKGIKNTIRFNFVNGDQRAISIAGMSFEFGLFDQFTNTRVVQKALTILDDTITISTASQTAVGATLTMTSTTGIVVGQSVTGDGIQAKTVVTAVTPTSFTLSKPTTSVVASGTNITFVTLWKKGSAELTLVDSDTINLTTGKYIYSVLRIEGAELSPVFLDGASSMSGSAEVIDTVLPRFVDSDQLSFLKVTGYGITPEVWSTDAVAASRDGRGSNYNHSAQAYFTNFTGTFNVYGTLDNSASNATWVQLSTNTYTGQNTTVGFNLTGVFNYFKFEYSTVSGSIDKVLYRS